MGFLSRIVAGVSGAAKSVSTAGLRIVARYDAAGQGRRMRGWQAPATGPNRAIAGTSPMLHRARDAARNDWAASAGVRVKVTNLIGTGIIPRPRTEDPALKALLIALWDSWSAVADADGVLDFYGMETLVTRAWVADGECFARLRNRRMEDGLPVPLQVQLLESDMLPMLDVDAWPGMTPGNRIRSGIELDRLGRRTAFWFYRAHPGDAILGQQSSLADLSRVPAAEVLHIFKPLRPGQLRGVTSFAPILAKLRGVMNFDDAVLERQALANLFTMFVTRPPETAAPQIDPITGQAYEYDKSGVPMAALEPGTSHELLPGEDVRFSDPPDAGANYAEFMRQQNLGIAAGQDAPYELLTGDIKEVSDRTLRVVMNDFRRQCEQEQWHIIIPMFCQRVRAAWAHAAMLSGAIRPEHEAAAAAVTWAPHGWAYLHPVQDVQSRVMEIEAGLKARSMTIAERGDDAEATDAARAADKAREERLGLQEVAIPIPQGSSR